MNKDLKKMAIFFVIISFVLTIFWLFVIYKINRMEAFLELKNPKGVVLPWAGKTQPFYQKKNFL
jgi:hypothetical protein